MSGDLTFLDDNLFNQLLANCSNQENLNSVNQVNEDDDHDDNQLNQRADIINETHDDDGDDNNQHTLGGYNDHHHHNIVIINASTDNNYPIDSYNLTINSLSSSSSPPPPPTSTTTATAHQHSNLHGNIIIPQDSQDDLIDHEYETDYSVYENKSGLAEDMKFLASMPELCDVTFLVGETREPVCAVRSVLAARSRTFHKLLYAHKQNQLSVLTSSVTNNNNNNVQSNNSLTNSTSTNNKDNVNCINNSTNLMNNNTTTTNNNNNNHGNNNIFVSGNHLSSSVISSSRDGDSGDTHYSNDSQREKQLKYSKSKKWRDTNKETKLKLFLKRSSEPALNGLPVNHHHLHNNHHPHHQLTVQSHQTMIIEEFEPDVFRQLIEYIHTGCVTLQARTLLGLLNAADYYGLDELRRSCLGFVSCCITVDTVCALLASAERYIQYKCTKSLVQRVLEYVDQHGNDVLSLGSFALLPEHVVRLILSREELKADELTKFHAALSWSQRYCDASPGGSTDLREVMSGFFECIEFYKIPATILMREVHPLGVVPDHVIMNALAFQADPRSVDLHKIESPNRFRRMTLPHTLNIAGSDLLNLQQQSAARSERSASTSTSGYISNSDLNHITINGSSQLTNLFGGGGSIGGGGGGSGGGPSGSNTSGGGGTGAGCIVNRKESTEVDKLLDKLINNKEKDSNCNLNCNNSKEDKTKGKPKEKDKSWRDKIGKRKASRPFRRAKTLLDSN